MARERRAGLDKIKTYRGFAENTRKTKRALLEFLIEAKDSGKTVAGYGAPAKGNTLLNYCGIGTDFLDYTVDKSPHKQGLYLPGSRIPIFATPTSRVSAIAARGASAGNHRHWVRVSRIPGNWSQGMASRLSRPVWSIVSRACLATASARAQKNARSLAVLKSVGTRILGTMRCGSFISHLSPSLLVYLFSWPRVRHPVERMMVQV